MSAQTPVSTDTLQVKHTVQIESKVSPHYFASLYGTRRSLDSSQISESHKDEESNAFEAITKVQGTGQTQGRVTEAAGVFASVSAQRGKEGLEHCRENT